MDPQVFRQVISHFASGVTVITTRERGTNYGMTASAVTSLTLEPPMLLVCINKNTGTQAAISRTRVFAVNILDEGQADLAYQFAKPQADKFQGVEFTYGEFGEPLLAGALAHIECRVAADVEAGTHRVFLAEVERAKTYVGSPLTYFQGKFGRFGQSQDEAIYREMGCVAKIFKLIKNDRVVAATTNSSRENEYVFYSFYLCWIVEYISF